MYKLLRSLLFCFDPEKVHYFSMNTLKLLCGIPGIQNLVTVIFKPKGNHQFSVFNIQFLNRVGLGAGFDKNAKYLNQLQALGFGFVEIGTVTPLPQAGNDKPRLFRLPKDKALINRMGFNNDGVDAIAKRLQQWKEKNQHKKSAKERLVVGGNIGKNKITPNEDAWKDYEICFKALHDYVDYFVVNVSSPNTPGLRELQEKDSLRKILGNLQSINKTLANPKPILLKIAPDLSNEQVDDVIDLAFEIKLDGLVAANTTISRNNLTTNPSIISKIGAGGLSGLPVKDRSTAMVQYIHQKTSSRSAETNWQIPIIASGGIFTGAHAKEKADAGASLVQVWTGFIYEGPGIVKKICAQL
ncbi:MAG: quinone-dependent dihydroorotate dehydrogenase [Ferruginibacter sp.]|nr:quinone-dependent dihydroorotate dehydrogenase [Bacteroidota bacterium]MBX2919034.1 quinone-dependent dihydroorotate dehydrogenase [Ferruginibacter sp.]MCB0710244.1 quinone-dependent dihydroorotate dehydrogenase [Chitinophagaceae bacterium]MCC7378591.1 quinone-dependent dihydroorotate dehydrogenase [Chitinophagaceae bacterium]